MKEVWLKIIDGRILTPRSKYLFLPLLTSNVE
jgi:hypothetical protein